jgi:hypothetical protein
MIKSDAGGSENCAKGQNELFVSSFFQKGLTIGPTCSGNY